MMKLKGRLKIKAIGISRETFNFAAEMAKSEEYRDIIDKVRYKGNEYCGTLSVIFSKSANDFVSNEFTREVIFREAERRGSVIVS